MKNFRKAKIDANQKPIVDHLQKHGAKIEILGNPVDLFAWLPRFHWGFIEIKIIGSRAIYTRPQLLWIANTSIPVCIAHTGDEAMLFLQTGIGVSQEQKDGLTGFLLRNADSRFQPSAIDEILNYTSD